MKMTSFEGRIKSVSTKEFHKEKLACDKIVDNLALYLKANDKKIHVSDKIYLMNYPGSFMDRTRIVICLKESLGPEFDCFIENQSIIAIKIIKQFGNIKPKKEISSAFSVEFHEETDKNQK